MASMVAERKPHFKLLSFIEKQRSGRVSDMQQQLGELHDELMRAKEERSRTLEELAELKRMNADSAQSKDRIKLMELQAAKAKDSERQMIDSMVLQTKQLEQTRFSYEEAKLEIKKLKESLRKMERSEGISGSCFYKKDGAFESVRVQEEKRKLRNELRLALEAEEKSKLAMDDFTIALNEVSSDMNKVKEELAAIESELEKAREGSVHVKSLLRSTEEKLIWAVNGCDKAKMEYEDSVSASKVKEKSFLSCMDISEEEITKWRQLNSRLNDSWKVAREENSKLREIMKQAVNESIALKDALESAQRENSQMKDQLSEKGNDLQKVRHDYESLKVSEAAALDSVRELNILLSSASISDSKKASNLSEGRRSTSIFSSGRWKANNNQILNRRRHSVGEPGLIKISTFDREKSLESNNEMFSSIRNHPRLPLPSFPTERGSLSSDRFDFVQGIEHNDTEDTSHKKKKNVIGRLGNALSRRSFHR